MRDVDSKDSLPPALVIGVKALDRSVALKHDLVQQGFRVLDVWGEDGASLPSSRIRAQSNPRASRWVYGRTLTPGEWACAAAHREALHVFLQAQVAWAVVLEDDAVVDPDFASLVRATLRRIPEESPCMVLLFFHGDTIVTAMEAIDTNGEQQASSVLAVLATPPAGAVAYLINQAAASLAMSGPDVITFRADWPAWTAGTRMYGLLPNPVKHAGMELDTSSIVGSRPQRPPLRVLQHRVWAALGLSYFMARSEFQGYAWPIYIRSLASRGLLLLRRPTMLTPGVEHRGRIYVWPHGLSMLLPRSARTFRNRGSATYSPGSVLPEVSDRLPALSGEMNEGRTVAVSDDSVSPPGRPATRSTMPSPDTR